MFPYAEKAQMHPSNRNILDCETAVKPARIIKLSAGEGMKSMESPGMCDDLLFEALLRIKDKSLPGSGGASAPSSHPCILTTVSLGRSGVYC